MGVFKVIGKVLALPVRLANVPPVGGDTVVEMIRTVIIRYVTTDSTEAE